MNFRRISCPALLLTLLWGTGTDASAQATPGTLVGRWQCEYLGEPLTLVFESSTRLIFDGEPAEYSLIPGKILVSEEAEVVEYGYTLEGNRLVVDLNEGFPMSCTRAGPSPAAGPSIQVGDPSWGYKFNAPAGWKWKSDHSGAMLGHDTIPGMILVIPHHEKDLQSVGRQLSQGLQEEDLTLAASSRVSQTGNGVLNCDITGVAQGQRVKGRAYGTVSPYGGGAYVLGVTTPEKFGEGIAEAARAISSSLSYFKVDITPLIRHFAGMWASYSGGSGGGTLINYEFYADGTFADTSETSYNINSSSDGWRTPDTNIGATGRQSSRARWTVRGTLEAGQIIITQPDGSERYIDYRIFVEKGRKYLREFVFDGRHFSKRRDY